MMKDVLYLIAGLLTNVQSGIVLERTHNQVWHAATGFETVWVRDVTAQFQADKRALGDLGLPNQLTFILRRGLDDLTLNLKRNYEIDPNADIYVVQKLKDGRPYLAKSNELESEAVAYYQDRDNGAYMTVRSVKISNHKLDFVINGNIRIGDFNYHLRPVETDVVATGRMPEVPSLLGKRYVLLHEANFEQENIVDNCYMENVRETHLEEKLIARLRRFTGQGKENHFLPLDVPLPRNVADLEDKRAQDKIRQPRQDYNVKVAVLIDFAVWTFYASRVHPAVPRTKNDEVQQKIKEAFSHIMNGVNLHYKTIDDPSISINVILQNFVFFEDEITFPHNSSRVVIENRKQFMHAHRYSGDLKQWVKNIGVNIVPTFDHAMLFSKYELYKGSIVNSKICVKCSSSYGEKCVSPTAGVCDEVRKVSLIQAGPYVRTVQTAAHELGHNLGADHDGELDAKDCKAEDSFIMSPRYQKHNSSTPYYTRNPWIFSKCSVESFKKTLITKECVKDEGSVYNTEEWKMFMQKQPGDVFTPDEQCYIVYGPNTVHYGAVDETICHVLKCRNRTTRKILHRYIYAARGTTCGTDMWCIEGKCASKGS